MMIPYSSLSQKKKGKIKILGADEIVGIKARNLRILRGNVKIKQKDVIMYCDSAFIQNTTNNIRAYGHVKVEKGRKLEMTGDSLFYESQTRIAKIRGNITLKDGDQVLKTTVLDYNLKSGSSQYFGGGVITNEKEKSVLKSKTGTYNSKEKVFFFSKDVKITTEEYDIETDSAIFYSKKNLSYFYGSTKIISDSNVITCNRGFFDRKNDVSSFVGNATLKGKANTLQGDSIYYNKRNGNGEVFGNAMIHDTTNNIIVKGDYAFYNEKDSASLVKGNTEFIKIFEKDSLFLHADTLYTANGEKENEKTVFAYNHVKFFKSDMQGKCDSLVFSDSDSTIRMFGDPIIWSDENQMTGDNILIKNYDGKMEYLEIDKNAFIVSEEDSTKYNQIKGKYLKAFFQKNELHKIKVNGNGETIYYGKDDNGKHMGMNRLECSNMLIFIDSNQIDNIRFYVKPDAVLYPLDDLTDELMFFRHFEWREKERPKRREDIHIWIPGKEK